MDVTLGSDGKSLDFTKINGQTNNIAIPSIAFKHLRTGNPTALSFVYNSSQYRVYWTLGVETLVATPTFLTPSYTIDGVTYKLSRVTGISIGPSSSPGTLNLFGVAKYYTGISSNKYLLRNIQIEFASASKIQFTEYIDEDNSYKINTITLQNLQDQTSNNNIIVDYVE